MSDANTPKDFRYHRTVADGRLRVVWEESPTDLPDSDTECQGRTAFFVHLARCVNEVARFVALGSEHAELAEGLRDLEAKLRHTAAVSRQMDCEPKH